MRILGIFPKQQAMEFYDALQWGGHFAKICILLL
jgi:hypothetical protein